MDLSSTSSFEWNKHESTHEKIQLAESSLQESANQAQSTNPASGQNSHSGCFTPFSREGIFTPPSEILETPNCQVDETDTESNQSDNEIYDDLVLDMFKSVRRLKNIDEEVNFIVNSHLMDPRLNKQGKRQRCRLFSEQEQVLELEFQKEMNWSTAKQKKLAKRLNLSMSKVYKWCWDRKKRFDAKAQS